MEKVGTVTKQLPGPWQVAGQVATEVEVRAPLLEDLVEAEKEANPAISPNAFRVALACRQVVRAGSFTGPFAPVSSRNCAHACGTQSWTQWRRPTSWGKTGSLARSKRTEAPDRFDREVNGVGLQGNPAAPLRGVRGFR